METALSGSLTLVPSYVYWHYVKAAKHIWRLAADFSWFFWHFFSIGLLAQTFFAPWWREVERVQFSPAIFFNFDLLGNFIASKLLNLVVLAFGVMVRGVVILIGLAVEAVLWIVMLIFFILWLLLPVFVFYFIFAGIVFLLRPL